MIKVKKGKDVDLYSVAHVQDTSNAHLYHWNWAARPFLGHRPQPTIDATLLVENLNTFRQSNEAAEYTFCWILWMDAEYMVRLKMDHLVLQ